MLEYLLPITAIVIISLVFNNYRTMKDNNRVNIKNTSYSSTMTNIEKNDCYSALGWLAREGKITVKVKVRKK